MGTDMQHHPFHPSEPRESWPRIMFDAVMCACFVAGALVLCIAMGA